MPALGPHVRRPSSLERKLGQRCARTSVGFRRGLARGQNRPLRRFARGQSRPLRHFARGQSRPLRPRAGLTLIEILVVIVIVAIAASGVSVGLGAITKTNLRSACVRLVALSQYGYHRALANGTTVRLTLDLDEGTVELSEAEGRVSLVRSDAPLREEAARDDDRGDPGAAIDPWAVAKAKLEKPIDELQLPPSPFSPIRGDNGKPIKRFARTPVGDDIRIAKVIVAHEEEARVSGKTDLFFFPSGLTQHAVVQLRDRGDTIYSVEIHPLTGRAVLHNVPYQPEVLVDDPSKRNHEASELEDRL